MAKRILLTLSLIILSFLACLNVEKQDVFADSVQAYFDYNLNRIERFLPTEMTKNIANQTVDVTGIYAEEPNIIGPSILYYYDYVWTVDGSVVDLQDYVMTEDTTFVALWTPREYTIYYNYMTENEKGQIKNLKLTDKYSVESPVVYYRPERPHYAFIDWYLSPSFRDSEIAIYTDTYAIGDKVLYAKFTPIEYYITYHTDASNRNNPYSYNFESPDYELEAPEKDGHIFRGWYLDENCTYLYDKITQGSYGDLDLYPLWELEKYQVTYKMPNGETQVISTEYGKNAESPKNYNSMFELVIYDGDRNNITSDIEISVRYVNIWYLYVVALIVIVGIIISIVMGTIHKRKQLHKLRYIYHSNYKGK